jgi:hypothetical protein
MRAASSAANERELAELLQEVRALRQTLDQLKAGQAAQPSWPPEYQVLVRTEPALPADYAVLVRSQMMFPPEYEVAVRPSFGGLVVDPARARAFPPEYEVAVRPQLGGQVVDPAPQVVEEPHTEQ